MRTSHIAFFTAITARACRVRAGANLLVDQSSLSSAVASEIAGAGFATDSDVASAVSGLALQSAVDTALALKADQSAVDTALSGKASASDLTNLDAAVKGASGKPFNLLETLSGAGGVDQYGSAWTMPFALASGDYQVDVDFVLTSGATQLGVVSQRGWKGRYDATANGGDGGWTELLEATTTYKVESGTVDPSGFFGDAAHLPGMDVSVDSGVLSTIARPRNGQSVTIAVDGMLRALGVNLD